MAGPEAVTRAGNTAASFVVAPTGEQLPAVLMEAAPMVAVAVVGVVEPSLAVLLAATATLGEGAAAEAAPPITVITTEAKAAARR